MPVHPESFDAPSSAALLGWAAAAVARAEQRREHVAAELLFPDHARLDERTRSAVRDRLRGLISTVERDLRLGAARRLAERDASDLAAAIADPERPVLDVLIAPPALVDADLLSELIGQAGLAQLAADLQAIADDGQERPSLLVRLVDCPEPPVAQAARHLLRAANEARDGMVSIGDPHHARLCWLVAAALSRELDGRADQAIVEAALDLVGGAPAVDEQHAAAALAEAIAARPEELAELLVDALGSRVPALFVAFMAEAVALPATEVRDALLDREAARLVVMLRAAGLARGVIARIGVAIAQADPRRDLERFADLLDAAMALSPEEALAGLAPLGWPQPFRQAQRRLFGA